MKYIATDIFLIKRRWPFHFLFISVSVVQKFVRTEDHLCTYMLNKLQYGWGGDMNVIDYCRWWYIVHYEIYALQL